MGFGSHMQFLAFRQIAKSYYMYVAVDARENQSKICVCVFASFCFCCAEMLVVNGAGAIMKTKSRNCMHI